MAAAQRRGGRRSRRDPRVERTWRQRVARWQRRGGTIRAFCATEGVSEHSFHSWRRELRRRDAEQQSSGGDGDRVFVELVPASPSSIEADGRRGGIEIVAPGGLVLRVSPGFDRQALADVLAIVRSTAGC
jgi:transposase